MSKVKLIVYGKLSPAKRYNTATDRLTNLKLGTASLLMQRMIDAASSLQCSCHTFQLLLLLIVYERWRW